MLRRSPNATLTEKLKEHYHNTDFTSHIVSGATTRSLMTVACLMSSFIIETPFLLLTGLFSTQEENGEVVARSGWFGEGLWLALFVTIFLVGEVTWNWWRVYYDVPNWVTKETKETHFGQTLETPPGWKHCLTCQLDAPPRSHHCKICNHCILKREHHCYFTSSCVGFYTQRHFVMFCIYAIWALLLAVYFQLSYLDLSHPLVKDYIMYIPPVPLFEFLQGNLSFVHLFLMVHMYTNLFFVGLVGCFLCLQLFIIARGQTSYEAWKNISYYRGGLYQNITAVFGSFLQSWILLFAPLLLPLEGDGVKWTIQSKSDKGY